jgi:hypothetical protein
MPAQQQAANIGDNFESYHFNFDNRKRFFKLITIFLAILIAIISYYFLEGWFNIFPWTIFTLLIGFFSLGKREMIFNGALFGYFLFLSYIIIGYKGNFDKTSIMKFILFALTFSLVGAIAGIIGALIGSFFKNKLSSKTNKAK